MLHECFPYMLKLDYNIIIMKDMYVKNSKLLSLQDELANSFFFQASYSFSPGKLFKNKV